MKMWFVEKLRKLLEKSTPVKPTKPEFAAPPVVFSGRPTRIKSRLTGLEYQVVEWYEWEGFGPIPRVKIVGGDSPPSFAYSWPQDFQRLQ